MAKAALVLSEDGGLEQLWLAKRALSAHGAPWGHHRTAEGMWAAQRPAVN